MSRLVLTADLFDRLRLSLFKDEHERCAILFARAIRKGGKLNRLIVYELMEIGEQWYEYRDRSGVQIKAELIAQLAQRCRQTNDSLIFVHNHPFSFNEFSKTDDAGEALLADFFAFRTPELVHASLLLTPDAVISRLLGKGEYLRTCVVGMESKYYDKQEPETTLKYDRQIRVFGKQGQQILGGLKIGITGLGGTGSVVAQQLAYLGIQSFLLIDPDTIEESNLNRVVGANSKDVGTLKINVSKRLIEQINPNAKIEVVNDSILKNSVAEMLSDTDFAFCCTDSHGSRAILNQLAYQYLVPIIDMGVVISVQNLTIRDIVARTQLLAPGIACMVCGNLLDSELIRRDLLSDFERKNDPYILNDVEPAPAVISLNSTIASLAITMFLNSVTGVPGTSRFLNYNAITGVVRPAFCEPYPSCIVCSKTGSMSKGDSWPLPGRKN